MGTETKLTLAWLVRLRWIAIAVEALAGALAFRFILLDTGLAWPYFGTLAASCFFNGYSRARLKQEKPVGPRDLFVQLTADTLTLTALLAFSGGIRNPLTAFLFLPAGLGAMLLAGKLSLLFVGVVTGCLAGLFLLRNIQVISGEIYVTDWLPLVATFVSIAAIWLLISRLSRTLAEARAALDEMKEQRTRMDQMRALGAMTAELSHQFATPLNTIKLRAARLRRKAPPTQREDLEAIADAVAQCEGVLRQIAAAPKEISSLSFRDIDVNAFVGSLAAHWRASGEGRAVSVISPAPPAKAVFCRVPPVVFGYSLLNLLDNAAQAHPQGAVEVEVALEAAHVSIAVKDRGPGFPDEVKRQIGQPFVTTRAAGTGLGLYNCVSLCEALQGKFLVEARPGGGSIARMVLPAVEASRA